MLSKLSSGDYRVRFWELLTYPETRSRSFTTSSEENLLTMLKSLFLVAQNEICILFPDITQGRYDDTELRSFAALFLFGRPHAKVRIASGKVAGSKFIEDLRRIDAKRVEVYRIPPELGPQALQQDVFIIDGRHCWIANAPVISGVVNGSIALRDEAFASEGLNLFRVIMERSVRVEM